MVSAKLWLSTDRVLSMRAELVGIGTELLLGQIANENARWMSEELAAIGVDVLHHQVVGDNVERMIEAFELALSRSDVVISTGGLGPTQDDITRDAIAAVLGVEQERHPEIEDMLRAKFDRIGRPMAPSNLVQAMVPAGCRFIVPDRGTAPGLAGERGGVRLYAVPGVPAEMREMMSGTILPELRDLTGSVIVSRVVRATGIAEARVGELLEDLFEGLANPTVAYLASSGEVKVRLTAKASDGDAASLLLEPVVVEVAGRLGDAVFTVEDESLEEAVVRAAAEHGMTLAVAESITGGTVVGRLTSVPGASDVVLGGIVAYTEDEKVRLLDVSRATIANQGVVSREVAREMAQGARTTMGADLAVGVTGVAGPGPHDGVQPGQVWVGLEGIGVSSQKGIRAPGDREQVRRWAQQAALDLFRRCLTGLPLP